MRSCIGNAVVVMVVALSSHAAEVSIVSIDRSVGVQACVFAPPNYPNWCDSDGGSNASAGLWNDSGVFGNSAAGDIGFGSSITVAGQYGTVDNAGIDCNGGSRVEIESSGACGSSGVAHSYVYVTFQTPVTIVATLYGGRSGEGGVYQVSLAPEFGDAVFVSSGGDYSTERTLPPGTYIFRAASFADASCSGGCLQTEIAQWTTRVTFSAPPCPADLTGDTLVDDADFVMFVAAYNELLCPESPSACPADFNHDGMVEDSDFVFFAAAYNELLCP